MVRKACTLLMVTVLLAAAGQAFGGDVGDFAAKTEKYVDKAETIIGSVGQILDAFSKIGREINKVGRQLDPQYNPEYVKMREREIARKKQEYEWAKHRYEDSGWWEVIDRPERKRKMEDAEREYMESREKWERDQYQQKKNVADSDDGMFFRKADRKKQATRQLQKYADTVLECERRKLREAKHAYEDCWGIAFWKKRELKKKYEEQKQRYEEKMAEFERMVFENSGNSPWDYVHPDKIDQYGETVDGFRKDIQNYEGKAKDIAGRIQSWEKKYSTHRSAIAGSQGGAVTGTAVSAAAGPGIPLLDKIAAFFAALFGQETGHQVDKQLYRRRKYVENETDEGSVRVKRYNSRGIGIDTSDDM